MKAIVGKAHCGIIYVVLMECLWLSEQLVLPIIVLISSFMVIRMHIKRESGELECRRNHQRAHVRVLNYDDCSVLGVRA